MLNIDIDELEVTNAERLVALAEILREQVPCDRSKVEILKKFFLAAFEDSSQKRTCAQKHVTWIQAFCEIAVMARETQEDGRKMMGRATIQ